MSLLALKQGQQTLPPSFNGFPLYFRLRGPPSLGFSHTHTCTHMHTHTRTRQHAHAMSSASITGNNSPPSFIVSWRWFPQGAAGSLRCQTAGQPQQCCREPCASASLLVSLSSSEEGLTHGLPAAMFRIMPIERASLGHVKSSQKATNWQGFHYRNNSFEESYFTLLLQSRVLSEAWLQINIRAKEFPHKNGFISAVSPSLSAVSTLITH